MAFDPQDLQEIRLYLLGRLEPEERSQRVEERMLTEPDYYEELLVAEDELVDGYVSHTLNPEERESFERHFLSTPERVRKLRFARVFGGYVADAAEARPSPAPAPRPSPAPARHRLPAIFRPLFASPARAAAAVAIVLAVCSLLAWRAYVGPDAKVDEGLTALNQAYVKGRPVEARITGWQYAPWSVTRGGERADADALSLRRAELLLLDAARERPGPVSRQALGRFHLAGKKFDEAIALFEQALGDDDGNASLHNDLGVALMEKAKAEREGGGAEKAVELLARGVEHFDRATRLDGSLTEAYFNRALAYQQMVPRRQAEEGWREYLRRDASSPWADEARKNLKLLEESGQAAPPNGDDALKAFLEAARARDDEAAWKVVGYGYTSAGNALANRLLDSELGLAAPGDPVERDAALPALSYLARLERDRDGDRYTSDLVGYYERATAEQRALLRAARGHSKVGYELFTKSEWPEAIGEYEKALSAYERAGDETEKVFVEYRLAHCYILLPDLLKARAGLEKLSAVTEAREYRRLHARSLFGLAHVSINSNEFSKAADYSDRALSVFERAGDVNGVLGCLGQLADVNRDLNRVGRSLGYLQRGLSLTGDGPAEPTQRWGILVQVALALGSRRLNTAALFYQKEALSVALEMEKPRPLLVSRSHGYVGSAYASLKMYPEALDSANRAFEIARGMEEGKARAEIMGHASQQSGDILRQSGECGRAVEAYDRSIRLYGGLGDEYYTYAARRGKLLCFMDARDDVAAGEELRTVLSLFERYRSKITAESQRNSFFDKQQDVYDLAIRYGFERMRDPVRAFEYSEESRARSLLEMLRSGGGVPDKAGARDVSISADTRPMSLAEIQNGLPEKAQVLQYAALEDRLLLWVVSKSGVRVAESGVGAEELSAKVRAYLAAASAPPATEDAAALAARAAELYRLLVAPAEPFLDRAKFLCVVPDKVLHYLPYAALVSPATGKYLIEDYDLGLAPSSSVFVAESAAAGGMTARASEEKLLSVGEPSFDRAAFPTLAALPSASREAGAVSDFYGAGRRVLLRAEASEHAVRSELPKADVTHFAMHYVVDESSEMLSGFPLAPEGEHAAARGGDEGRDGFLQSYEIYRMKLPRTRLVVLSACQTGIEQQYGGEGAVGVARPFLVAGVPLVVASLWPVDTAASAELMVNFHRHRRRDALPATEALRRAQTEMARGPDARYRHPYYWAAFVAIGGHTSF